ncbi:MAG TPA: peptidylprolyl isomerase [Kofleriaceae bacterium]|nr:peptidylprolyl isomerase [Kofleriaceae bacterium]
MRHLAAVFVAAISCHAAEKATLRPAVAPERGQIADAEVRRAGGVAALIALAKHADPSVRALALRGLGRTGTPDAIAAVREALRHGTTSDATAAAAAIGIASALGSIEDKDRGEISAELIDALARARKDVVIEALGRAGDASALPALIAALDGPDAPAQEQAALALGRFGRRGLPIDDDSRAALVRASTSKDAQVRYAATYALSRETIDTSQAIVTADAVVTALEARMHDADPEIRAVAIAALARRNATVAAERSLVDALPDGDWRVSVEAVRALAGDHGTDHGREAVAVYLVRRRAQLARATDAHAILEGLRLLAGHADRDPVRSSVIAIMSAPTGKDALSIGWMQCLGDAALGELARLASCGGDALPAYEREILLADAIGDGRGGTPDARWAALAPLVASKDARVASAAISAAPKVWKDLSAEARDAAALEVAGRLEHGDDAVVESAGDAVAAYLADHEHVTANHTKLSLMLVDRASSLDGNPEVAITLLGDLGTALLLGHTDICEAARGDPNPAVAAAGRACVAKMQGGTDPGPKAAAGEPTKPPVDPGTVIGHDVTWHVETTRGAITIALDPDLAPWHVAAIVALTRAHTYDGLTWHRVVPDFVAQGGDPTGTGAGGPGYTLPAEPGSILDGGGYTTGAVGIADAGPDTGGSQWFVMHDRAPHLDGRYTRIGRVTAGQDVVDALQIDDRILRATVDVR